MRNSRLAADEIPIALPISMHHSPLRKDPLVSLAERLLVDLIVRGVR